LAQRILILDGAMGTMIQRFKLNEAQYWEKATPAPVGPSFATFTGHQGQQRVAEPHARRT
jgi:methionine synthase I (cobalamin-dependent)